MGMRDSEALRGRAGDEAAARATLEAVFAAVSGGVAVADACHRRVRSLEVDPEGGAVACERAAIDVRLVGGAGRHLEVRLGDVRPSEVAEHLAPALAWLEQTDPEPSFRLAPHPDRGPAPAAAPVADPVDAARALSAVLDDLRAAVEPVRLTARARLEVENVVVADPAGLWRVDLRPRALVELVARARRGSAEGRFRARYGARGGIDALADAAGRASPEVDARARWAAERSVALLDARLPTLAERRRLTHAILHPSALGFLAPFAGAFAAEALLDGASDLFRPDGRARARRLGPPSVSVVDGPLAAAPGAWGVGGLDDEGVFTAPVVLVQGGVASSPFASRRGGLPPSGRCFHDADGPRRTAGTDTWLVPAEAAACRETQDALLAGVGLGLWLEGADDFEVVPGASWGTAQYARLVRDGRLTDEVIAPCRLLVRPRHVLAGVESFHGPIEGPFPTGRAGFGGPLTRLRLGEGLAPCWPAEVPR